MEKWIFSSERINVISDIHKALVSKIRGRSNKTCLILFPTEILAANYFMTFTSGKRFRFCGKQKRLFCFIKIKFEETEQSLILIVPPDFVTQLVAQAG